jgi:thiamine biosynthesis lipoprotein
LRKQREGMEVDLSSIAQGYSVDALADVLRRDGAKDFMVELGGEVYAQGKRQDDMPWRIAIERPLAGKREMESAVTLSNAGLTTAGGSRHFFEYQGKRYSHIIDPATGRPVENALSSVTVAADSCTEADGWDTPLVVLGSERGKECAEKNGIAAMFISHTDSGDEVRTTTAWEKRFGPAADGRQIP